MKFAIRFFFALLLCTSDALALNEVELVSNFNTYPLGSYTGYRLVAAGKLFFTQQDELHGRELWVLDSPTGTPQLVKDILPGPGSSNISNFVEFKGKLFFAATSDAAVDPELWSSDGTEAGTVPVGAVPSSATPRNPSQLTVFGQTNDRLAYRAERPAEGTELCFTSGSAASTTCYNLAPGTSSSFPGDLVNYEGDLFFSADDGTFGEELWVFRSNGIAPFLYKDITGGSSGSNPSGFTVIERVSPANSALIFSARNSTGQYEPYVIYGPSGVVQLLADLNAASSSNPRSFTAAPFGGVFFTARTAAAGEELWYSNGSIGNANMISDIGLGSFGGSISNLVVANNLVLFQAQDDVHGTELWKSDGTTAGTTLVKDLVTGPESSQFSNFFVHNDTLFFSDLTYETGEEIFSSNGTSASTGLFADLRAGKTSSYPKDFFELNGTLGAFADTASGPAVVFLNATDGSIINTILLSLTSTGSSYPDQLVELPNGKIFMQLFTEELGEEPYVYDTATNTITLLKDIYQGPHGSYPSILGTINGKVVFYAEDKETGGEPWISDGTPEGTFILKDIYPNDDPVDNSSYPYEIQPMEPFKGHLYFVATTKEHGEELWRTDGTSEGTALFFDALPGPDHSSPRNGIVALGDQFFFHATIDNTSGVKEIWKTDGTPAGTIKLTDFSATGFRDFTPMHEHEGFLYMGGRHPTLGNELFRTDGTVGSLALVADINTGAGDSLPYYFYSFPGNLLFSARSSIGPSYYSIVAPYTAADLSVLVDPDPSNAIGGANNFFEVYDKVFFTSITENENTEPWMTDGTTAGTQVFKIIQPGPGATEMGPWYRAGDFYYFSATGDEATGNELWRSDGTPAGTTLFKDLRPGENKEANPKLLGVFHGALYFTFLDDAIGNELWRIVFDECPDDTSKVEFGLCGCGLPDIDSDGDGTLDCSDNCPSDPAKVTIGSCGCGVAETDSDGDGSSDCQDQCVGDPNKTTPGACGCGQPDVDLDQSGIIDCLFGAEARALGDSLASRLNGLRFTKKRKAKKAVRGELQSILDLIETFRLYISANAASVFGSDTSKIQASEEQFGDLGKQTKRLKRFLKKKKKKFNKQKKKAALVLDKIRGSL